MDLLEAQSFEKVHFKVCKLHWKIVEKILDKSRQHVANEWSKEEFSV
jgi:hypothetical protein